MIKLNKILTLSAAVATTAIMLGSCAAEGDDPGYEFMPNMYRSPSYETYAGNALFADSLSARKPVEGTIPRGFVPYEIPNTEEGYQEAYAGLKNPIEATEEVMKEGKELYTIFCTHCHGDKGDGQGILVERDKFAGIPSYADPGRTINEGTTFHVITYGKGVMGSHASQISTEERWKIVHHVMSLQKALMPEGTTEGSEEMDNQTEETEG